MKIFIRKTYIGNNTFPKLYSKDLKKIICDKKRLHKLFKSSNDKKYFTEFSNLRALCKIKSKVEKWNLISSKNQMASKYLNYSKII